MKYDYDVLCIGLGPAGMAVSIMASEMGLKVCAIEKHKIGGECMNVGCIPSKALLRIAKKQFIAGKASEENPFAFIEDRISYINQQKTSKMFDKVDLVLAEGRAEFVDAHTVQVGHRKISAKRIYIATGTEPMVPPISGIDAVADLMLTNMNMFHMDQVPSTLVIIGGGAIGTEMAQAFSRLGCKCTIVHMDDHLIPVGDHQAAQVLEEAFEKEGIAVYNQKKITSVERTETGVAVLTEDGLRLEGEKLLMAAGRRIVLDGLRLENAGVEFGKRGIVINKHLQTNKKHIYAIGDCNGKWLLSHAAMHQGMLAIMNSMMPFFMRQNYAKYTVPWTVFTEPQISYVGLTERQLQIQGKKFETIVVKYADYGAAIAESVGLGFVKAFISPWGKIYGVSIVGEGSGEMINEWALAIQQKINIIQIMLLQHSFPTMGFLSKRIAETWMMNKMKIPWVRKMCQRMF